MGIIKESGPHQGSGENNKVQSKGEAAMRHEGKKEIKYPEDLASFYK